MRCIYRVENCFVFQVCAEIFQCRGLSRRRHLKFSSVNDENFLVSATTENGARASPNEIIWRTDVNEHSFKTPLLTFPQPYFKEFMLRFQHFFRNSLYSVQDFL